MKGSNRFLIGKLIIGIFLLTPLCAQAAYDEITFRHDHHIFSIDPDYYPAWNSDYSFWSYKGQEIELPSMYRADGDDPIEIPSIFELSTRSGWNRDEIRDTLNALVIKKIARPAGEVIISRTESGVIVFEGVGLLGRTVHEQELVDLTIDALEVGVTDVVIPVEEVQPQLTVLDDELKKMGIKEVVTVGESDFSGSTVTRKHNVRVGLSKFNGQIIPQDSEFSFNELLGPVNYSTGYKKELVILGDRTLPEYGGGLCQVSTTAYRGIWEQGFPITSRRNHSYAVSYYSPQGTDATIYPPHTDMKFLNDGPSALLMQTHMEGTKAYFIYYGTADERLSEVAGPFTWNYRQPPPPRTELTTEIAPGAQRVVGREVVGMNSAWFRVSKKDALEEEKIDSVFSWYSARPLFTQFGVAVLPIEPAEEQHEEAPLVEGSITSEEGISRNRPSRRSLR